MPYEVKNFDQLLGTAGFSDALLKNHFALYQGYVTNFNKLNDLLVALEHDGKFGTPEYAELNRRLGWEWNGMRLHELYFGNMTHTNSALPPVDSSNANAPMQINAKIADAVIGEWGSYEMWEKDFRSMGAMRGIGWVIMYFDAAEKRLFNVWVNEHDVGHLAGCQPLLVMDVFEHAYMLDYGLKRADYIEAFFKAINWNEISKRYLNTVST